LGNEQYVFWAEGVGKSFGDSQALKAASFWARAGTVTTLMGRNGSGKTTLLRIAAGALSADYGVVSLFGQVLERPALYQLARRGLMFLPQGRLAAPPFTVRDHFRALRATFPNDRTEAAIALTNLEELLDLKVATLSGGERARVSLGLAYARRPAVLLADEPLVGLAPVDQERLALLLKRMAAEGAAVVTSGHDVPVLLSVSDAVIWSVAGTTHFLGSPAEAYAHQQFNREYLGPRSYSPK
jgi:ABC-type multidrug transport system ATPase subunit